MENAYVEHVIAMPTFVENFVNVIIFHVPRYWYPWNHFHENFREIDFTEIWFDEFFYFLNLSFIRDPTINCVPVTEIVSVGIVIVFLDGPELIVVVLRQQINVLENLVTNYVLDMENVLAIDAFAIKILQVLDYLLENFVKSSLENLNLAQL